MVVTGVLARELEDARSQNMHMVFWEIWRGERMMELSFDGSSRGGLGRWSLELSFRTTSERV